MITPINIFLLVIGYLLGSVPSAVWVGQLFYGIDVREFGSGNAGATNTFRVLGKKAGIPVLIMDVLKGWAAVNLSLWFTDYPVGSEEFINLQLALAISALLGHVFPVFVGFRGGKGVATLLGVAIAVHFYAAMITIGVFVMMLLITNYVSLSSISAALSFPISVIVIFKVQVPSLVIFSLFISVLIMITHQKNIERLMRKNESKVSLFRRRKSVEDDED
jgi:acyl phosphate:glycerol-3-phosphate acyltransferase